MRGRDFSKNRSKDNFNQFKQQDPYKLSIHTSSHFEKSQTQSKRQNISRMLQNSRKKISLRKAGQLFQSGVRPKSSKIAKRNQVIQFDNIKWISIIAAYDPNRLKNVSIAKKSCLNFLKNQGTNIKNDSRSSLYFNDLIKNFKSWLNKIHIQYFYIMETFLNSKRSVNTTLVSLRPKLDEVIQYTGMMQQKLQDCLNTYQNHQFRQLIRKYKIYLQNSRQIQDIIIVVNKSKAKIDSLFQRFEDDRKIQEKINKVKQEGINQAKKIVCDHNQVALQSKIMDRIQMAINEMTQKSGQAYRKIRGVKQLIQKFKNSQHKSDQAMNKVDMNAISLIGKVCKEICFQAEAFEAFSEKFLKQGDIINDDLKRVIKKYEQQITTQRKKAIDLQMKFLGIIFTQTIKKLKQNSKIATVYQNAEQHHEQYRKILKMIQDISDCLVDQNKIISLQKLIKETRTIFDRLYDQLRYLKQNKQFQEVDTDQGLISILEVNKLMKQYKQKIHLIRNKFESHQRDIYLPAVKVDQISTDAEIQFINQVIALSKKINNSNLKQKIHQVECFSNLTHISLQKMSSQIQNLTILQSLTQISNQFLVLQEKNILQKFFGPLRLHNLIFKETLMMTNLRSISNKTTQKNLIPQLEQVFKKRNQWIQKHPKTSSQFKRYFDRILARTLFKGLKREEADQIDNSQKIVFPTKQSHIQTIKTKIKYRKLILDLIQRQTINSSKLIKHENQEMNNSSSHKSKHSFAVSGILQINITTMNDFVDSFHKLEHIKKNYNSATFIPRQYIFQFCQKLFSLTFLKKQNTQKIVSLLKSFTQICKDKVLNLTRRIFDQEQKWKQSNNSSNGKIPVHIKKIIELLQFYKQKHQILLESATKAIEQFMHPNKNFVQTPQKQLNEFLSLNLYGKIIWLLVNFSKDTNQIIHTILDNQKNPVALLNPVSNMIKKIFKGLKKGRQLSEAEMNKLTLKVAKVGIEIKVKQQISKKKQNKQGNKNDKKPKKRKNSSDLMDQQIVEDQQNYGQQFDEEIQQDDVAEEQVMMEEEQMAEQEFDQEINQIQQQQPKEDMVQQFQQAEDEMIDEVQQQKIQDQQNLDQLIEESQNISKSKGAKNNKSINKSKNQIDDFQQYQWEEDDQKQRKKNKKGQTTNKQQKQDKQKDSQKDKKTNKSIKESLQQVTKKNQQAQKQKAQKQRQARLKKQHIVFSQTQVPKNVISYSIYEVYSFITSLFEMKKLILFIFNFQENYFSKHLSWENIQQHFNDHYLTTTQSKQSSSSQTDKKQQEKQKQKQQTKQKVKKYVNALQQDVQAQLKQTFKQQSTVLNQLKNIEKIKNIKQNLIQLKGLNWQILQSILSKNNISYNIFKNPFQNKNLFIQIKSQKSSKLYDQYGSIHGYLTKNFKYYQRNAFDLENYIKKCFNKQIIQSNKQKNKTIIYSVKNQKSLIKNLAQVQAIYQKLIQIIDNFSSGAKDIVDKYSFCISLYKKSLKIIQKIDINLNWYSQQIKYLQNNATQQNNVLSYVKKISQNVKNVIKKTKSIQSKLQSIAFKCTKQNIFQCISQLNQLYGQQITQKVSLTNGKSRNLALVFDKSNYNNNLQHIKKSFISQSNQKQTMVQKTILSLLSCQKMAQSQHIIQENKCIQNAQKITKMEQKIIIQVLQLFRINHCYIWISKNSVSKYFTLAQSKQTCISNYLKKTIQPLKGKLNSSKLKNLSYLQPLNSLLNSTEPNLYKSIFDSSKIDKLFKEKKNQTSFVKQTQVIVDTQTFNCQDNWQKVTENIFDEIIQSIQEQKNEVNSLLDQIQGALNPCQYIYQKYISAQRKQDRKKWQAYIKNFQELKKKVNKTIAKNNWLLCIKSILSQLKDSVIDGCEQNINSINKITDSSKIISTFSQIFSEINQCYDWFKNLNQNQNYNKKKCTLYTLNNQKQNEQSIIFFDLKKQSFKIQNFINQFSFIQPKNNNLSSILFRFITQSSFIQTSQDEKSKYQLSKEDSLYRISSQKLSNSLNSLLQYISGGQYTKKRSAIIRKFVRTFNKIYFVSKTTKSLNFKQQIENLYNIEQDLRQSINQLQNAYHIRSFLDIYSKKFPKNESFQMAKTIIMEKLQQNERILEEDIPNIYKDLDQIKIKKDMQKLSSYNQFFSWFFNTIKNILDLPFYNLITHTIVDLQTKSTFNQFLAFIITQNPCDPGQTDNQLQQALKQMFLFTQHKPIYLKSDNLTVQLTKQPVFIQFQQFSGVDLNDIIKYLQNNKKSEQQQANKDWFIRVDQMENDDSEERKLLKIIPLRQFLISSEQQFNIQISKQNLTVSVEINIGTAPQNLPIKDIQKKLVIQSGFNYQSVKQVYIGKKIKLKKLTQWLYNIYTQKVQQDKIINKKDTQLQQFYKNFTSQFLNTQKTQAQKKIINSIFQKIKVEQLIKQKVKQPQKKLILQSSLGIIDESIKCFNEQKNKIYRTRKDYEKYYDKYIKQMQINFKNAIISKLLGIERKIKKSMQQQLLTEYKAQIILIENEMNQQLIKSKNDTGNQRKPQDVVGNANQINGVQNIKPLGYKQYFQKSKQDILAEQLSKLKKEDFKSYLVKRLSAFGQKSQQEFNELCKQIEGYYKGKHTVKQQDFSDLIAKIIKRINVIIEDYQIVDEAEKKYIESIKNPKNKIIFIYLLVKENQKDYLELFALQVAKKSQNSQSKGQTSMISQ